MQIERLGPYRIVGKLGRGGMGTVYEGINQESGECVAIKLLSPALAQEEGFRGRFEAEIETLRKLNHPNIVRLFGFGEQDGQLFYAMELVDGNSLAEELERGRRFDWREVIRIVIDICRALRHAHDRGVVHRDIKPGNLLLATNGKVKLSDFGIARLFGNTGLTSAGSVLGTAEYMAPEQAAGKPVDQRADLYSLGAVMYTLLAGRPVFRGKSLGEVLYKQQFETPDPLRRFNSDVPEELDRIILQLLEKDPTRRIPNAVILGRCFEAMKHAMHLPAETIEADAAYYRSDSQLEDIPPIDDAALIPPESGGISPDAEALPDTQPFPARPHLSSAADDLQLVPDSSLTVPTLATPLQITIPANSQQNTTSRFVPVSREELGREEFEQPQPAIISIQTWAILSGLLLVGFTIWYFLQPPAAEALFKRIEQHIGEYSGDKNIESLLPAEDYIREFLERYPDDPRAYNVRNYQRDIDLYNRQRKFDLRLVDWNNLRPIERAYLEAIGIARISPEQGIAKLRAVIDLYQHQDEAEAGATGECLILARRRLEKLTEEMEKYAPQQLEVIQKRLDEADALATSDPKRAQAMYRATIELYAEKPWASDVVRRAQAALESIKIKH